MVVTHHHPFYHELSLLAIPVYQSRFSLDTVAMYSYRKHQALCMTLQSAAGILIWRLPRLRVSSNAALGSRYLCWPNILIRSKNSSLWMDNPLGVLAENSRPANYLAQEVCLAEA